jgi:hypothetical protein
MQVKFPRKLPVTSRPYRLCDEKSIRRYGGRMQGKGETRRTGSTRREIMTAAGASALALSVGAGLSNPPVMATGRVFEDRSGSGRRGPRDPGIADVMVSNGHNVVRTDVDGHWRLPIEDGDSVFVIKPPHWSTSVGPSGLPQFSCLYQPQGSPGDVHYYHPGVAPTGELPSSIDFGLRRREESRQFEALLLADTQPANDVELAYLRDDIMASIAGSGAAFAINHGDVVFDDLDLYARYLQIIGATGIPWHHCPGNHDINWDAHDDRWSRETWKRVFGPRHYAFQHADATFILLDNVHYTGRKPGSAQAGKYLGRIGDDQLRFVRNVLAHVPPEQLVIISMHIPLATYQDPTNPSDNTVDCAALLALLAGRSRAVSFSGHMHLTEHHYLGPQAHHHHVLAAASGGWWGGPPDRRGIPMADCPDGAPNGFHALEVDGTHYATRFIPAQGKAQCRLRVVVDGPSQRRLRNVAACNWGAMVWVDEVAACEIVVNVFDGGPRTSVVCEFPGQAPAVPMQRTVAGDPFVVELFARQPEMQRSWVQAIPSSHIWTASVPQCLQPGAHRLTVRVRDEYGVKLSTNLMLEIMPRAKSVRPAPDSRPPSVPLR